MPLALNTGNKAAGYAERGRDLYQTPAEAVRALLALEQFPARIWEPACGPGAIVGELEANGFTVLGSDIHDYGWGHQVVDFLKTERMPEGAEAIITNPPFKSQLPRKFAAHALQFRPAKLALLMRIGFFAGQRRMKLLNNSGLRSVWGFGRRLPMMHREDWEGNRANSGMDFAWFVWERGYRGRAQFVSIDWEDYQ